MSDTRPFAPVFCPVCGYAWEDNRLHCMTCAHIYGLVQKRALLYRSTRPLHAPWTTSPPNIRAEREFRALQLSTPPVYLTPEEASCVS